MLFPVFVSILVLVDVGLRLFTQIHQNAYRLVVSILVLVDVGLRHLANGVAGLDVYRFQSLF